MSIKIPRRELRALIDSVSGKQLADDEYVGHVSKGIRSGGVFERIEDILSVYKSNLQGAKSAPNQLVKRKTELNHFKEALEAALLWGGKAGVQSELAGVAEFHQLTQSAKTLLPHLEKLLALPMPRGKRPDERKWAIGQLAGVYADVTGKRATIAYDDIAGEYRSDFFAFARLCFADMKPQPFQTEARLAGAIRDTLRGRGRREAE